ncbi:lipoprotein LpqH [Rhodococcus sp. NPDC058521]|uniref:lipoprotein LpqH n=1 Tax=Rhodococcus sp. NPDC058521 TaxID=3346536 RepID=UPI003655532F
MGKVTTARGWVAPALAAGLLILGASACSSDESDTRADSDAQPPSTTMGGGSVTPGPDTETSSAAPAPGSAPTVKLDGQPVDATFDPARCKWETDEGHPQLEFDAGSDSTGGDLEVEIVMSDPPRLDDFTLETGGTEWEANTENRQNATITIDGDSYRVVSQVSEDNGTRTAELEASFTCAKQ